MTQSSLSMAAQVYDAIRERVCSGQYLPGIHLVEADLAAEFHVSRITVRDALRRLAADELVEVLPYRGVRVRQLTTQDVEELYTVREPIESLAARLAAEVRGEGLKDLRRICQEGAQAAAAGDARRYMQLNAQFHATVPAITGNRTLVKVLTHLNTQMVGYQFLSAINLERMQQSQSQHEAVLRAIEAGDGDRAESAMRHHIRTSRAEFRAGLADVAV